MDLFSGADVYSVTLWSLALILVLILVGLFGFRKMRQGFREVADTESILETGKVPGANREMTFVFDTFQKTLQEISEKKRELIRMHKEAEERIRRMEQYNECILESMVSGVVAFDRQGRLTSMNQAACEILGWIADGSPMGKTYTEILEGSEQLKEILEGVLRENRGVLREAIGFTPPGGERKWLGVNASPLKGDEGEMIGATLLFTDITEIRRLQQQVDLKNRLAAMGEMSAGIAHEFRNSLGAVLGYARLVEKQAAGNEMLRVSAEGIMTEVRNFDAMLGEFLSFARPQRLNKEDCSLGDLVKEALEVLSDEIRRRGARIEVNTETPPPVTVDRPLMRQALVNLVKNALEAVGQGGMIRLQEKGLRGRAELWIEDNGPGITEENRKKIFQPFFTTKEGGTGLGLPITQKTILSHQGSLTIKSDREQETVVIVSLPAAESVA